MDVLAFDRGQLCCCPLGYHRLKGVPVLRVHSSKVFGGLSWVIMLEVVLVNRLDHSMVLFFTMLFSRDRLNRRVVVVLMELFVDSTSDVLGLMSATQPTTARRQAENAPDVPFS